MGLTGMIPKFGGSEEMINLQRWNNWMMAGILLIFLGILIVLIVGLTRWTPIQSSQKSSPCQHKAPGIQHHKNQKLLEENQDVEDIQLHNRIQ